jgi:hypothetical protein
MTNSTVPSADEINKTNHLRPGRVAVFHVGHDDTHEPDYSTRNGEVTIVRELIIGKEVDEECAPMYRVRRLADCPECDGAEQEAERDASDDYSTPCHLCNGHGQVDDEFDAFLDELTPILPVLSSDQSTTQE